MLCCNLPADHAGPHWDEIDRVTWRIAISRAIPRVTEAYLTPSADAPACRDEDPAWSASLAACYPDSSEHEGCRSCGAEVDHYLGCPDDPDPDYEAEAELRDGV